MKWNEKHKKNTEKKITKRNEYEVNMSELVECVVFGAGCC